MKKEKIYQLRKWLEKQSVNEIGSIETEQLQHIVNLEKKDLQEFIGFLFKEGLIRSRYKFYCDSCGAGCIEYEKNILKGNCVCGECEKKFSLEEIKSIGHLVYEISYEDFMELVIDEIDEFVEKRTEIISITNRQERIMEDGHMDNKQKVIFFGSSKEAEDTMDEIAALVSNIGYETLTWNSPNKGVFVAGNSILDSLIETAKNVDGAIFIFSDDDITWCRDEIQGTVRDNVLFEYGLFMGTLDKQKVVFANKNKPKLASDLSGVVYIDANKREAELRQDLKNWLKRI